MRKKQKATAEKYMVPVVRSAFRILEELSKSGALGLNAATIQTGLSKSTVFRVLTTLSHLGYVVKDTAGLYSITRALGNLVNESESLDSLKRTALPWMVKLRDEFGETVNLGHLALDKVVYVEVVPSEFALRMHERPGAGVAFHASALGKAILAFSPPELVQSLVHGCEFPRFTSNTITDGSAFLAVLRKVRARGLAFDRGEASMLAVCVAAPILDARGIAAAALSISGPASRFSPRSNAPVVGRLLAAVTEISAQLGPRSVAG